jgi:hypothetical protein
MPGECSLNDAGSIYVYNYIVYVYV